MSQKKSYRSNWIQFAFLGIALAVYFFGPRLTESSEQSNIKEVSELVKKTKMDATVKAIVIRRLEKDRKFAAENEEKVDIFGIKLTAVGWLCVVILGLGFLIPVLIKWLENKRIELVGKSSGGNG